MSPKHHPTPLSGGDRKALKKKLAKSSGIERMLANEALELRARGEPLIRRADALDCESWNERMWRGGEPIDPSPTVDQAINGGYVVLQIECARCRSAREINLATVKHVATTRIHDLASRLICDTCKAAGYRPRATLDAGASVLFFGPKPVKAAEKSVLVRVSTAASSDFRSGRPRPRSASPRT